jgi:hypothetical protein
MYEAGFAGIAHIEENALEPTLAAAKGAFEEFV